MATHDPLGTVAAVITSAPTLPGAGLTFTEPTFGTLLGQITGRSDEENAQLTVSTINTGFNYDSTRMIIRLFGGLNYGYWVYTLDPVTLLSSRTKALSAISGQQAHMETAQWDWSGSHNYRFYGVVNDNGDTLRKVVWTDVEAETTGVVYEYLNDLRALTAGTVVSASSTSVFIGNHTDPEATNDFYVGMTVTMNGETSTVSDYVAATKQVTVSPAFSFTPSAAMAYRFNYVGYVNQLSVTPNARYFSWAVSEGATVRGGGQDTARTIFFYDSNGAGTLYKHRFSSTELDAPDLTGGVHNIQIDKLGNYVMFSGIVNHSMYTWDPRAVNPTPETGDGTISIALNGQHRDVGQTAWAQFKYLDANSSSNLQLRTFASPGDGSGGIVWNNPNVNGKPSYGVGNYLSWNHAAYDDDFIFLELQFGTPVGAVSLGQTAWALDSGSVYKVTFTSYLSAGNNQLTAANNAYVHHNGTRLTAAASRVAMVAGTYFYDTATDVFYVWPVGSVDLVNQVTDITGAVVTPGAGSNTATRFAVNFASTTPADIIGRKFYLSSDGTHYYLMRTITDYEVVGSDHFVTLASALPFTPTAAQTCTAMGHHVYGWDHRAYVNELTKVYLDGVTPARRITPFYGVITDYGASQFDQQSVVQSNRTGTLVAFSTQKWNGGDNAYVLVAQVEASAPPAASTYIWVG